MEVECGARHLSGSARRMVELLDDTDEAGMRPSDARISVSSNRVPTVSDL